MPLQNNKVGRQFLVSFHESQNFVLSTYTKHRFEHDKVYKFQDFLISKNEFSKTGNVIFSVQSF